MHLVTRNVNTAFQSLVKLVKNRESEQIISQDSRNGKVFSFAQPFLLTLTNPRERVLFNDARDCNPFFHLYESLWMLAGRHDVEPLAFYNSKMTEFSDDKIFLNGAYGYRWRRAHHYTTNEISGYETEGGLFPGYTDQLVELVSHLKKYPDSRRAVLQMWNPHDDLLRVDGEDGRVYSKDVCCNTAAYFRIVPKKSILDDSDTNVLDMTVTNRSNDLIWGMLGANVVHFSFLQEWMASRLNVEVGSMHILTNNLHVYEWNWEPDKWLEDEKFKDSLQWSFEKYKNCFEDVPDEQIERFVNTWDNPNSLQEAHFSGFLEETAAPMMRAFFCHKVLRNYKEAFEHMTDVQDVQWREVGVSWLYRRKQNYLKKESGSNE